MRQIACWMADDAFRTGAVEWIGRLRSKARAFVRRTPRADANDVQVRDLLGMWQIPDEYEAYVRMRYDAFLSYVPGPYPGCAMVIRSRTGRLLAPPLQSRDDRWCQLLTGPLDLCYVPGSHHNVLESPFVEHVAAAIERGMNAANRSRVSAG